MSATPHTKTTARTAGTTYPDLLKRITGPLQMVDTTVKLNDDQLGVCRTQPNGPVIYRAVCTWLHGARKRCSCG